MPPPRLLAITTAADERYAVEEPGATNRAGPSAFTSSGSAGIVLRSGLVCGVFEAQGMDGGHLLPGGFQNLGQLEPVVALECDCQIVRLSIGDESDERGGVAAGNEPAHECGTLSVKDPLSAGIGRIMLEREQIHR